MDTLSAWIIDMVVWAGGGWVSSTHRQDPDIPWWAIVSGLLVLICYLSATLGLLGMAFTAKKCCSENRSSPTPCDNSTHTL